MTKALSRRTLLKGLAAARPVALALPPLEAMFNSLGTAYAADADADREPVRLLVQRQRHPGAVLDSGRRRAPTSR